MKINLLISDWSGRILLIPSIALPFLTNLQLGLLVLFITFVFDFLTGVLASYIEIKNGTKEKTESGWIFESNKARESVVKAVGYLSLVLLSYAVERLFFNKDINLGMLSDRHFRLTEIVVGVCIAIEAYSALFENLKRAGFDIIGRIGKIADGTWALIRKIKGEAPVNE